MFGIGTKKKKQEKDTEEKKFVCVKCKKEKAESEGMFMLEGTAFCCKECADEDKEEKDNVCEFC